VTVYGQWENQPEHVIPFFTSLLTDEQIHRAQRAALNRTLHDPLRILYVGRLSHAKNVHILISAINSLRKNGILCECQIIGEGPEYKRLNDLVNGYGLDDHIHFSGGVPFDQVLPAYEWADVLVLASETEGWPKAITEGMAFGLVCIGSCRGLILQMLGEKRGYVVEPGDVAQLTDTLIKIKNLDAEYQSISQNAATWSQQYNLSNLKRSLRALMIQYWKLPDDALLPFAPLGSNP
jgi:glycosyltransferase involved in cell wall biosynthesis